MMEPLIVPEYYYGKEEYQYLKDSGLFTRIWARVQLWLHEVWIDEFLDELQKH